MYTCEEGTELTLAVESVSNKSGPAGAHEATLRVRTVRVFIAPAMVNLTFVDICTHKPVELLTDDTLSIADDAGRSTIFSLHATVSFSYSTVSVENWYPRS